MCNVGGIDRALRIIVGLALLSLVFIGDRIAFIGHNVVWGWAGIVLLGTGIFSFCPAYALFGIKTCRSK
jgi:Inner membrane protein YgaP-like, transmembrane domain